jgi:hypothetical protein
MVGGGDVGCGVLCHFQQYFSYIMAVSFIGGGNREYLEKTTVLPQVSDKHYHINHYLKPSFQQY